VRLLRRSSLAEVVAAWLRAEMDSPRFGHHLRLGDVDRRLIEQPDLNDPAENALRRQLLRYRDDILTAIPNDTVWWEAELSGEDLPDLSAINYPAWEIYSGGTGKLAAVADAIRRGWCPAAAVVIRDGLAAIRENVRGIHEALEVGTAVGPLVLLGRSADGAFTVIEGNKRAAALCWRHYLDRFPCAGIPVFVGVSPARRPWLSPQTGRPSM